MSKQINFAAVTANSDIEIKVAKIFNPNTVLSEVQIGVSHTIVPGSQPPRCIAASNNLGKLIVRIEMFYTI